jgi:hypothetical protein
MGVLLENVMGTNRSLPKKVVMWHFMRTHFRNIAWFGILQDDPKSTPYFRRKVDKWACDYAFEMINICRFLCIPLPM